MANYGWNLNVENLEGNVPFDTDAQTNWLNYGLVWD